MNGTLDVFCNKHSVVLTSQKPERRLSKKHNAISYHSIRKAAAGKWIRIAFKSGASNLEKNLKKYIADWKNERYSMATDAMERGVYADLVAEPPKGTQAYERRTSIDNKDEDITGRNVCLSSWPMETALILLARAGTEQILEECLK